MVTFLEIWETIGSKKLHTMKTIQKTKYITSIISALLLSAGAASAAERFDSVRVGLEKVDSFTVYTDSTPPCSDDSGQQQSSTVIDSLLELIFGPQSEPAPEPKKD